MSTNSFKKWFFFWHFKFNYIFCNFFALKLHGDGITFRISCKQQKVEFASALYDGFFKFAKIIFFHRFIELCVKISLFTPLYPIYIISVVSCIGVAAKSIRYWNRLNVMGHKSWLDWMNKPYLWMAPAITVTIITSPLPSYHIIVSLPPW